MDIRNDAAEIDSHMHGYSRGVVQPLALSKLFKTLFLLLLMGLPLAPSALADTGKPRVGIILDATVESVDLGKYLYVLKDPAKKTTLDSIVAGTASQAFSLLGEGSERIGFTTAAYWFRLDITNPLDVAVERSLYFSQSNMALVSLYQYEGNSEVASVSHSGATVPFSERLETTPGIAFDISIQGQQTKTLYIRIATNTTLDATSYLMSQPQFDSVQHREFITDAVVFGAMLLVVVALLLLSIDTQRRQLLWYAGFLALAVVFRGIQQWYWFALLWPNTPILNGIALDIVPGLLVALLIRAFSHHGKYQKAHPNLYRLNIALFYMALGTIPLALGSQAYYFLAIQAALGVALLVGVFGAGVRDFQRRGSFTSASIVATLALVMYVPVLFGFFDQFDFHLIPEIGAVLVAIHAAFTTVKEQTQLDLRSKALQRTSFYIYEHVKDYICLTGIDWRILYANKALTDVVGRPASDLLGFDMTQWFPDYHRNFLELTDAAEKDPTAPLSSKNRVRVVFGAGNRAVLDVSVTLVRMPNEPPQFLFMAQDVTKQDETDKGHLLVKNELQVARAQTHDLETLMGTFVIDTAHSLSIPLNAMAGHLARVNKNRQLNETQKSVSLEAMQAHLQKAIKVVNTCEANASLLHGVSIVLNKSIGNVSTVAKMQVEEFQLLNPGHRFHFSTTDAGHLCVTDLEKIEQLLAILIDNAVKFSAIDCTISVEVHFSKRDLTLIVRDNGIGVDDAHLPHLTEKYYRDTSENSGAAGFGIGLHIAKEITVAFGGTIGFESPIGHGLVAIVTLPLEYKLITVDPKVAARHVET